MVDHVQAFADSARSIFEHLERDAPAAEPGSHGRRIGVSAGGGRNKVEYGSPVPLADARALWKAMADAGWLGILVPESRGGLGLGETEVLAICEVSGGYPRQPALLVAATQLASCLGDACEPRAAALLQDFLSGRLMAGLAWQEQSGHLEEDAPLTLLRTEPTGMVLSGRKIAVGPLVDSDGWIVLAGSEHGPVLVWVARAADGVHFDADHCTDGSDIGTLLLHCVRVTPTDILAQGSQVTQIVAHACDRARLAQAAMTVGLADAVLKRTLEYLRTRVQFGKALGSFQALQHRCVDAFMEIEVARACLADVLRALTGNSRLAYLASRAKARSAAMGICVTRTAMQLHGAIGVTDELQISRFFKRALHLSAWLGNASTHRRRCFRLRPQRDGVDGQEATSYPFEGVLDDMDERQFRAAVRDFLKENFPKQLRFLPRNARWSEWKAWFQVLGRKGWAAPAWPKEYGGLALSQDRLLALVEEQESFGVPRAPTDASIGMLGPLLIRFGSEYQKKAFLPGILSGETIWCQGYSEPNAGSDLASLRTIARLEGECFVVNGQKTWTSVAAEATHMFALVRTRESGPKQAGISFLLIDMTSPGLTVRPIRDMAGHDKFCEVFFDDVRVPREHLVGPLHDGWMVAKALLGFERVTVGNPSQCRVALYQLESLALEHGLFADAAFAQRFVELELDTLDVGALYSAFLAYIKRGDELPASVPLAKLWATETCQRITAFTMEAAAEDGANTNTLELAAGRVNTVGPHMGAIFSFIFAGTNDIQRNILARQALHLPA